MIKPFPFFLFLLAHSLVQGQVMLGKLKIGRGEHLRAAYALNEKDSFIVYTKDKGERYFLYSNCVKYGPFKDFRWSKYSNVHGKGFNIGSYNGKTTVFIDGTPVAQFYGRYREYEFKGHFIHIDFDYQDTGYSLIMNYKTKRVYGPYHRILSGIEVSPDGQSVAYIAAPCQNIATYEKNKFNFFLVKDDTIQREIGDDKLNVSNFGFGLDGNFFFMVKKCHSTLYQYQVCTVFFVFRNSVLYDSLTKDAEFKEWLKFEYGDGKQPFGEIIDVSRSGSFLSSLVVKKGGRFYLFFNDSMKLIRNYVPGSLKRNDNNYLSISYLVEDSMHLVVPVVDTLERFKYSPENIEVKNYWINRDKGLTMFHFTGYETIPVNGMKLTQCDSNCLLYKNAPICEIQLFKDKSDSNCYPYILINGGCYPGNFVGPSNDLKMEYVIYLDGKKLMYKEL